jgi:effector-binding domain-containing protein
VPVKGAGKVKGYRLEEVPQSACAVHHGPFITINDAYKAVAKWIEDNGYRCCGPVREIYLQTPAPDPVKHGVSQTDPNTVTEIQFPVEKT